MADNRNRRSRVGRNSNRRVNVPSAAPQRERGARPTNPQRSSRAMQLPSDYAEQERQARAKAGQPRPTATPPRTTAAQARQEVSTRPAASAPSRPATRVSPSRPSSSSAPAPRTVERTETSPSSAPKTGESSGMAEWRKRFPKLAEALDKRNATRGTSKTDNPLMADMKARMKQREDAGATDKPAETDLQRKPTERNFDTKSDLGVKNTPKSKEMNATASMSDKTKENYGQVETDLQRKPTERSFSKDGEQFGVKSMNGGNVGTDSLKITQRPFTPNKSLAELAKERRRRRGQ